MAVVNNFWLRDNKQKLGGAVIYQSNGQTLMRQLAPSVTNPRTDAQMEVRVRLANLVAFYRASSRWMRGAFENKPNNQSDYNAFVSANATANNVYLTKSQVDAGVAIVAPYQITRGSLGEIQHESNQSGILSSIIIGEILFNDTVTVADFSANLLSNNSFMREGDQLSLIQYVQNVAPDGSYTITCRAYEVLLNLSDGTPLNNYLPIALLTASDEEVERLGIDTTEFVGGGAFVLSRTIGGRVLVSSSTVALTFGNTIYPSMISATQQAEAIRSYGSTTVVFLDSNDAGTASQNVSANPVILSITIGSNTYRPGDYIPDEYTAGDEITVILSQPVQIGTNNKLQIDASNSQAVQATPSVSGTVETASIMYVIETDATLQGPDGRNTTVEIELANESLITANFKVQSGLE